MFHAGVLEVFGSHPKALHPTRQTEHAIYMQRSSTGNCIVVHESFDVTV
jgi:hypothetical protein